LLDWLAVTFRESGWDVKAMLKRMVMSQTYRQQSATRFPSDPENRRLARGSDRLSSEMLRDQALTGFARKLGAVTRRRMGCAHQPRKIVVGEVQLTVFGQSQIGAP
jgi:hypothetical protein